MFAKRINNFLLRKLNEMKTTTKKTETKTKTTKKTTKKVVRVFNANNESIDRFRSRLNTSASQINLVFIKKPKHVFTRVEIGTLLPKLKKSRINVHLYWLTKTYDHVLKTDNGYVMNAKPKSLQNK